MKAARPPAGMRVAPARSWAAPRRCERCSTRSRAFLFDEHYVDVSTGELYRFPPEALIQGSSPVIRKESLRAPRLVQISKNPYITTF